MRIELLTDTGEPPSLLRMFQFSAVELAELRGWFARLGGAGAGTSIRLAPRAGVEIVGLASLDAVVGDRDEGLLPREPARWQLTAETWRAVYERALALDPPTADNFQWLDPSGSTPVLLSLSGRW